MTDAAGIKAMELGSKIQAAKETIIKNGNLSPDAYPYIRHTITFHETWVEIYVEYDEIAHAESKRKRV